MQRGDAEMAQKLWRVVRACVELGPRNPIQQIHDQGAGGNCNVVRALQALPLSQPLRHQALCMDCAYEIVCLTVFTQNGLVNFTHQIDACAQHHAKSINSAFMISSAESSPGGCLRR